MSTEENGLAYRVRSDSRDRITLSNVLVYFGVISHGLPVLAKKENVTALASSLNPEGQTVQLLIGIFQTEYGAFGSMAKDFVRTVLFPRIADYVPSSTRQGAEAFLRAIRKPREVLGNTPTAEISESSLASGKDYERGADFSQIKLSRALKRPSAPASRWLTRQQMRTMKSSSMSSRTSEALNAVANPAHKS